MSELTAPQRALVESEGRIIIGLAGPGSGKTSTLIARYAHWIAAEPDGDTVIITFTQAAAATLSGRIRAAGLPAPRFVGTLHAFCLRTLRAVRPAITLIDDEESLALIGEAIAEMRSKSTASAIQKAIVTGTTTTAEKIVVMRYRSKLRKQDAEDYNTLLVAMLEHCHTATVSVRHLLVDEYQDSSPQDHAIYMAVSAWRKAIFGDPDQSIFGFRGGRMENLLELTRHPLARVILLEDNFRSGAAITSAAQNLISHNVARIDKVTRGNPERKATVKIWPFANERAEDQYLLEKARAGGELAILCRYNFDRARIELMLEAAGIAIVKAPRIELPADWRMALAALALAVNPTGCGAVRTFCRARYLPAVLAEMQAAAALSCIPMRPFEAPRDLPSFCEVLSLSHAIRSKLSAAWDAATGTALRDRASEMILWLRADATTTPHNPAPGGVSVLTIHAAKGREFDSVIVVGCHDAFRADEEGRRLLFVAMTRARTTLRLTYACRRSDQYTGKITVAAASPLLKEIQS